MKLSASMYHRLYNKIRVVGFRNEAGECLVNEVYKVGSLVNLLSFEFSDRRFPAGFSRADVAEMNTLLEKEGVDVVVVDPMVNTKQPTQNILAFLRSEMNLPAHEAEAKNVVLAESNRERHQAAEGRTFEPWDGKGEADWMEVPSDGK